MHRVSQQFPYRVSHKYINIIISGLLAVVYIKRESIKLIDCECVSEAGESWSRVRWTFLKNHLNSGWLMDGCLIGFLLDTRRTHPFLIYVQLTFISLMGKRGDTRALHRLRGERGFGHRRISKLAPLVPT